MSAPTGRLADLQTKVWNGNLPLEIRLSVADCRTYDDCDPYLVHCPRLSYLAFILPKLHSIFRSDLIDPTIQPYEAWLSFQGVPLKWHYPLGLLYDIFSGAEPADSDRERGMGASSPQVGRENIATPALLPWQLTVHFTDYPVDQLIQLDNQGKQLHGLYINSVKEADFIRNGSARAVMSLGREDSDNLWKSVQTHDISMFNSVNSKLLHPPGMELRHVPIKIYLPTSDVTVVSEADGTTARTGHIRVVQALVPLQLSSRQLQTIGTALNGVLPAIFPSRRNPLLAQPVLHGAIVPMNALIEDLGRYATYADGFLHIAIAMLS